MAEKLPILIADSQAVSRSAIESVLVYYERIQGVDVCTPEAAADSEIIAERCIALGADAAAFLGSRAQVHMVKPLRMGALLNRHVRMEKVEARRGGDDLLHFAGWILDVVHSTLRKEGDVQNEIRLTEKELSILRILYEHTDRSVSRDVLLDKVWGYVDGVETHTLETHIYRLRQKIEDDPAMPRILLTTEAGYQLNRGKPVC